MAVVMGLNDVVGMRHADAVSLRSLRHRLTAWLRIPCGNLAAFSLLVVLVVGSVPVIEFHAHADPGAHHGPVTDQHDLADHSDEHDHDQGKTGVATTAGDEATGEAMWHVHDACGGASALTEMPQLALDPMRPAAQLAAAIVVPAVSGRPASLLRPPIV